MCIRVRGYSPEAPLYVVAIGALTNIASALLLEPAIAQRITLVWLGGNAWDWPDNQEFNAFQDVAADRVVFGSGAAVVQLPCQGWCPPSGLSLIHIFPKALMPGGWCSLLTLWTPAPAGSSSGRCTATMGARCV